MSDCVAITYILHKYDRVSGQQVNIDKSTIIFSANTPAKRKDTMMRKLGVSKILAKDE